MLTARHVSLIARGAADPPTLIARGAADPPILIARGAADPTNYPLR
ncbi:MAG: hypothetical protein WAO00_00945 [Chthoniobacterales bacterium]